MNARLKENKIRNVRANRILTEAKRQAKLRDLQIKSIEDKEMREKLK